MYCIECKHYRKTLTADMCGRPSGEVDPVTGTDKGQGPCEIERLPSYSHTTTNCGPCGKYFERNWWPVVGWLGIAATAAVVLALWVSAWAT